MREDIYEFYALSYEAVSAFTKFHDEVPLEVQWGLLWSAYGIMKECTNKLGMFGMTPEPTTMTLNLLVELIQHMILELNDRLEGDQEPCPELNNGPIEDVWIYDVETGEGKYL